MSELDRELKKQTADVSITEMTQEADALGKESEKNTPEINEKLRGEDNNGK